jgi:hypothetical protein
LQVGQVATFKLSDEAAVRSHEHLSSGEVRIAIATSGSKLDAVCQLQPTFSRSPERVAVRSG